MDGAAKWASEAAASASEQPRGLCRRVPAGLRLVELERHVGAVRGICLEQRFHAIRGWLGFEGRRQAEHQLRCGERAQRVAGVLHWRCAAEADDGQGRSPSVRQHEFSCRVFGVWAGDIGPREAVHVHVAEHLRDVHGLAARGVRNIHFESRDAPAARVLDTLDQLPEDAEAGRHDAARRARMNAFGEHPHRQRAGEDAAQRGREPEPVVVAAFRVQADHEVWFPDLFRQRLHVGWQVVAAALFAAFDQQGAAWMGKTLGLQRGDGGQRCEAGVAVVCAAASVEAAAADHRLPRAEARVPALELGLLVVVAVEEHVAGAVASDFAEQHRRTIRQRNDAHGQAAHAAVLRPGAQVLHRGLHVPFGLPVPGRRPATCWGCGCTPPAPARCCRPTVRRRIG